MSLLDVCTGVERKFSAAVKGTEEFLRHFLKQQTLKINILILLLKPYSSAFGQTSNLRDKRLFAFYQRKPICQFLCLSQSFKL